MLKKVLLRACAVVVTVLCILAAWVFWGPVGSLIVEPLVRHYGAESIPALKVGYVNGSLQAGITLGGIELVSGDDVLLKADHIMIRPSWKDLMDGAIWLSELEIGGVRANVEDLSTLAARYGGKSDDSGPDGLRPIRVTLRDITFDTPLYSVGVEEGLLTQDGTIQLSADMGGLPVRLDGRLAFSPLEALSVDVRVGSGRAVLSGRLMAPFDIRGRFDSLKVDELLAVFSELKGRGDFDGAFTVRGAGETLKAWGRVGLTGGEIAGVPLSASVPWGYKEGSLVVSQAKMESLSADIDLKISADLRPVPLTDRLLVRGSVRNISMKNLDSALSLAMKFEGEGGMVDFWASADQGGRTAGKVFVRLPDFRVDGRQIVKGLRAEVLMFPDRSLTVDGSGEVFGAKLTARGETLKKGDLRPAMLFTVDKMNTALLAAAFPALASLAPSGAVSLSVSLDERLAAEAELRSARLVLGGVRLDDLAAVARYDGRSVVLDGLRGKIGRAPLDLSGVVDLKTGALRFDGALKGLSPASVPALAESVTGACDVVLSAQGTTRSPQVTVAISGEENRVADVPIRGLRLSGAWANDRVSIPETALRLPGGSVSFRGSVDLPKGAEPILDISGSLTGLDLGKTLSSLGTPITGSVGGTLKVSGPVSDAALEALVTSDRIGGTSMDIRDLHLDFAGTTRNVEIREVRVRVNGGSVEGRGKMSFERRGGMAVEMKVRGIEVRSLLSQFGVDAGMGGYLDGTLSLVGTPWRPELKLKVTSPLTIKETLVDNLAVTVSSPERGRLDFGADGQMGDLLLNVRGRLVRDREGGGWIYSAEGGPLDLDRLATAKMPSMKGKYAGSVKVSASGRLNGGRGRGSGEGRAQGRGSERRGPQNRELQDQGPQPVDIAITLPSFSTAGITMRDVSLPLCLLGDQVTLRDGTARLFDGAVSLSADVNLPDQQWRASVKIEGLDLGQAAEPFMSQGAIAGSADVSVSANGDYGTLMMVFARGDFKSGSGYIHEFSALDAVTKDGRLPFEEIRGSFFWDGKDLWLNPGSQATAPPGAPLYRYFALNGSLGIPGTGLGLMCQGRFDVQALNTVLGALKSAFQYMTGTLSGGGSLGGSLLRGVAAKVVGYTEHDFQDVTFQLKGSWQALQLLNLKISKSLEGYLPLSGMNDNPAPEGKDAERKFQINLRIPTGPGSTEDGEDTENQIKKQILDNLIKF